MLDLLLVGTASPTTNLSNHHRMKRATHVSKSEPTTTETRPTYEANRSTRRGGKTDQTTKTNATTDADKTVQDTADELDRPACKTEGEGQHNERDD